MCNECLDVVLPVSPGGCIDEVMSIQRWVLDVGQQQSLSTWTDNNQITPQSAFAIIQWHFCYSARDVLSRFSNLEKI